MLKTISFNGITKPYLFLLRGTERPAWAPVEHEIIEIPGRSGGLVTSTKQQVGRLNIAVGIEVPRGMTMEEVKEDMAGWLLTDSEAPLVFSDRPDRTYYARIEDTFDPDNLVLYGEGVLTFIYPEGFKHGPEHSLPINPEGTVIQNKGTAETKPVFSFNVTAPSTMIEIAAEDDYMAIGRPLSVEDTVHNPRAQILYDQLQSLVGWGQSPVVPEVGVKSGVMISNGEEFMANDYGVGNAYHGPVMQRTHTPLTDYEVMIHFNVRSTSGKQRGRAEAYLLGESGIPIAKIMVVCPSATGRASVLIKLQNVSKAINIANRPETYPGGFFGFVRLSRKGTDFTVEIVQEGTQGTRVVTVNTYRQTFRDLHLEYQQPMVGLALHVAAYGTFVPLTAARLRAVRVYRLSEDKGVPYIVQPGDEVIIDHVNEEILINGETRTDLKDFGGNYFPLKRGENILTFNPPGSFTGNIKWRERYR